MKSNEIAIIGDIHGCINTLSRLYAELSKYNIPVYCVGDFIDRGNNSKEVVDFIIKNNIQSVKGNHENWFLDAMVSYDEVADFHFWSQAGGFHTIKSYLDDFDDFDENTIKIFKKLMVASGHYDFVSSLPLKYEVENIFISHAGKISSGNDASLLYNYGIPEKIKGKLQVFGHRPKVEIEYIHGWYANIDTGCVFGNKLTAIIVDKIKAKITDKISVKKIE